MKIFKLPDLGEGLQEAEIVQWHVKPGDRVKTDQPMVSVETAKAIVDIPGPYAGVIERLYGNPGDITHIGAPLVGFEGEGADASARAQDERRSRDGHAHRRRWHDHRAGRAARRAHPLRAGPDRAPARRAAR